jgi:hypothetical protein
MSSRISSTDVFVVLGIEISFTLLRDPLEKKALLTT